MFSNIPGDTHLFGVKGLFDGVDGDMFDFLLCRVEHGFGHVHFKVGDVVTVAQFVLSMGDRFYSLTNDHGFSDSLLWRPEPMVEDPVDFVPVEFMPRLLRRSESSCQECRYMYYIGSGIRYGLRSGSTGSSTI